MVPHYRLLKKAWPMSVDREPYSNSPIRTTLLSIHSFQFASLALMVVRGVIIARVLGPAEKGVVDLFVLLGVLTVELGTLGFGNGLLYFLARRQRPFAQFQGTALAFSVTMGLLIPAAGLATLPWWRGLLDGLAVWQICIGLLQAPALLYARCWHNICEGLNRATAVFQINFFFSTISLVAVLAFFHFGILSADIMILLTAILALAQAAAALLHLLSIDRGVSFSRELGQACLRYGFVLHLAVLANVLHFKLDQLMINYWLDTRNLGLYALSVRWAEMLLLLDMPTIAASVSRVASAPPAESYALTQRLLRFQFVVTVGASLGMALAAYSLVVFVYGSAYEGSIWPLITLIPGVAAWSLARLSSIFLVYNQRKLGFVTAAAVTALFANAALNYVFLVHIPLGIIGAALASSITYVGLAATLMLKARLAFKRSRVAGQA